MNDDIKKMRMEVEVTRALSFPNPVPNDEIASPTQGEVNNQRSQDDNLDQCPSCGNPAVEQCRCLLGDRTCKFGHEWHKCPACGRRTGQAGNHKVDFDHPSNWCFTCQSKGT